MSVTPNLSPTLLFIGAKESNKPISISKDCEKGFVEGGSDKFI